MLHPLEPRRLFAVALDPTFGVNGQVSDAIRAAVPGGLHVQIAFVHEQGDGKLLVGGSVSRMDDSLVLCVARYTPGGLLDTGFGGGDGFSALVPVENAGAGVGGAVQSDGKILLAASRGAATAVARFNADGSVDTAYGGGDGLAISPEVNPVSGGRALEVTGDDKLVLIGNGDAGQVLVARLNTSGAPDTSFDADGVAAVTLGTGQNVTARDVEVDSAGKIFIVGDDAGADDSFIVRLAANGAPDAAFDGDGIRRFDLSDAPSGDFTTAILLDGTKMVVGGQAGREFNANLPRRSAIARFNADGSFDTSFGGGDGITLLANNGGALRNLARDGQGRYVAARGDTGLVRVTSAGAADATFAPGGDLETGIRTIGPLAITAGDRIVLADSNNVYRFSDAPRPELELAENGTLFVTNSTGNNTITIAASGNNVVVTRNGTSTNFPAASVLGLDILTGGGNDTITVTVDRRATVVLGDGVNALTLGDGDHTVTGGDGADDITAGDGKVELNTAGGADEVTLGAGDHRVDTGAGNDTVSAGASAGRSDFLAGDGDDVVTVTGGGENDISGGAGNDTLTGGAGEDRLFGGDGDDELAALAGDDQLLGGAGSDSLAGGDGDDQLFASESGTTGGLGDAAGANVLDGGGGKDYLVGAAGRDTLLGGAQADILLGNAGSDLLSAGGGNDKLGGGGGPDRLYGGPGKDQLDGGNHDDRLFGQGGNDKLYGGKGLDTLTGEAADDLFFTRDNAADEIDGGSGSNTAVESDASDDILNATKMA